MFKRFLILFCLVCLVCLPSLVFGQAFNVVQNESFYPNGLNQVIPPSNRSDLAVIKYTLSPYNTATVVSAEIIPNITRFPGSSSGGWGWYQQQIETEPTTRTWYSVISADTLYTKNQVPPDTTLRTLQECLVRNNLGTVAQRQALINTFSIQLPTLIEPSALYNSFLKQLQPFILKFLAVGLILLSVSKGLNYLEKLAAVKHKQREAFRKRGEKIAQRRDKEYTMLEQWTVAAAVRYVENPTRLSRKEFYEQLKEYNDYRASKGWKY